MPKLGRSVFKNLRPASARSTRPSVRASDSSIRLRRGASTELDLEASHPAPKVFQRDALHSAKDNPNKQGYSSLSETGGQDEAEFHFKESLLHERQTYVDRMREEYGGEFDEEEVMKEFVRIELLKMQNNSEVRMAAEALIEEHWLGDALPGNLYRIAVLGSIADKASRNASMLDKFQMYARMWGMIIIVSIQIIGPPMIFMSRMFGAGVLAETAYRWECCPWYRLLRPLSKEDADLTCGYHDKHPLDTSMFEDWWHIRSTKALGMLMMTAFILNGIFVVTDERKSWKKIYATFRYLDRVTSFNFKGIKYLYVDACMNCWVISWSCLDVFLVLGAAQNPSEVLMNALALMFLYNLDDISGDFGFVDDTDWPGSRLAWIYEEFSKKMGKEGNSTEAELYDWGGSLFLSVYNATVVVMIIYLIALPLLAACTPFIQVVVGGHDNGR